MSTLLTAESLAEVAGYPPPCLSLYQSTHRHHPENQQDPIRFRSLVRDLETSLLQQQPGPEARLLLQPFEALAQDHGFWTHTLDGLAALGAPGLFRVFLLQRPVAESTVVADTLYTRPLRRFLQSVGRYQLLGLGLGKIRLFEGNRDTLDEIEPAPGVPRSITEALGDELTEPHQTVASHGGVGGGSAPMHHGQGGKSDEVKKDKERFFRAVDRTVLERHSRPSGLPLVLVALPEHHHLFREISHNPFLMAAGLAINPDALSVIELRERAWQVVEPQYQARLAASGDEFKEAQARGRGTDDLALVAQAATDGRVATLLIEADRLLPGKRDGAAGQATSRNAGAARDDDVLDELGDLVERMGGEVQVLPAERMPTLTGLAATYRY